MSAILKIFGRLAKTPRKNLASLLNPASQVR
nr:MAG TPA: hypothetical protein [Caudoviricetes sp.]